MMMESAVNLRQSVLQGEKGKAIKRSDLERIRNRLGLFVHSMPGEKKMDHK